MANVYNPNVAQITIVFERNGDGSRASNTLYFTSPDAGDTGEADALINAIETWIDTEWQPLAANSWKAVLIEYRHLISGSGIVLNKTIEYQGAVVSESAPNNVTIALSFRTGYAGRSRRGRNYFVGAAEIDIANNELSSTVAASYIEGYEAIKTITAGAGWTWVVYSRYENNEPRTTGLTTPVQTVILTDLIVDSMRSRLPNH